MTGEEMLKAIGFEKCRLDGCDYWDNTEYSVTLFDNGCVKVDSHTKPVVIVTVLIEAIYKILGERGHLE